MTGYAPNQQDRTPPPHGSDVYNEARMISQDLLEILVCPACKKPVSLQPDGKGLKCGECRRVYPIQDDIPIMLIDSATVEPS